MDHGRPDDPVADAVYYTLFKVASIADLSGDEKAVEWTRRALESPDLVKGLADGTRRATDDRPDVV
ncbi:MAG: hypothetical protein M3350_07780 [Actinomycetota bacterium]|nr:hypothetical protein [Actinomycetota bacterium]